MDESSKSICYSINSADEIVTVGGNWDRFALANDATPQLLSANILHRSLWDFVTGDALVHVYRRMLARVRSGESVSFSFRCDSPALRRFLTMRMTANADGSVEFATETIRTESREFQPLFSIQAIRGDGVLVACSWCNKIKTNEKDWLESEDAVRLLKLFESDALPALSHGICGRCYEAAFARVDAR
jgi:hypothetical protein